MGQQTDFKVLIPDMIRLGSTPLPVEGVTFVGHTYQIEFELPVDLDPQAFSILQCRTLGNRSGNKCLFFNTRRIPHVLEGHPDQAGEWIFESVVIPKGWLETGENSVIIGYADADYESFIVDDMVLWFKTRDPVDGPLHGWSTADRTPIAKTLGT